MEHHASASRREYRHWIDYVVQGDDLILFSSAYDLHDSVDYMRGLVVITHPSKCLIGAHGDFLRAIYTHEGRKTYPMRSLRSIFYANPWVEQRAFKGIVEISQNWLVVESRFSLLSRSSAAERAVRSAACADIARWSGGSLRSSQVRELFCTPLSVGGLGPVESVFGSCVTTLSVDYDRYSETTGSVLPSLWQFVGVTVPLKPSKRFTLQYVDLLTLKNLAKRAFYSSVPHDLDKKVMNLTSLFLSVIYDTEARRRTVDASSPEVLGLRRALRIVGYTDYRPFLGGI